MISIATLIGRSGHPEYFDYAERYLRNYISNLQFIVTPEFEAYYRRLHADKGERAVADGLEALRRFQGGIIGGSGLNDFENELLGRVSGFEMFGCCAPEGMRAIHTAWTETIGHRPESKLGPAGVYVDLGLSRALPLGRGRVVHARRGPPDGQGGRPRHLLPPPAALGAARSGARLRRRRSRSRSAGPVPTSGSTPSPATNSPSPIR